MFGKHSSKRFVQKRLQQLCSGHEESFFKLQLAVSSCKEVYITKNDDVPYFGGPLQSG
jgi:hypothetical protein